MATRTLQFFMRPAEFWSAVWEAVRRYNLVVIPQRYLADARRYEIEVLDEPGQALRVDQSTLHEIFLAAERPYFGDAEHLYPNRWGWVASAIPREVGNMLFLAQIGAKSDWWDSERHQFQKNPTSLVVFRKVAEALRKRLRRPVWAYNEGSAGEPKVYRDVGYSEGAVEWVKQGGQLRQKGPAMDRPSNTVFLTEKPS